jgi:hypothetical protein
MWLFVASLMSGCSSHHGVRNAIQYFANVTFAF